MEYNKIKKHCRIGSVLFSLYVLYSFLIVVEDVSVIGNIGFSIFQLGITYPLHYFAWFKKD